ncbi:MAG: sulfate adenylyltransferase [Deltaproteobacteria bacterium]|nr:sulfate adenylyltransferase [Deltaproteobacteria bacterium]
MGALHPAAIGEILRQREQKELLRLVVVGSVDDGKSTLIGRLLYELHGLYQDQIDQVRRATKQGGAALDFSLFTDGLLAEREQAITIDVAYRYCASKRRKLIIADTPGHVQYTRNMATGASTADVAVILLDARLGTLPQTRRHAFIAALLGIRQLVVAVNKMDLVGFSQAAFEEIRDDFLSFAERLGFDGVQVLPLCASDGDNVAAPSARLAWHSGATLLELLDTVPVARHRTGGAFRFPVQGVLRPNLDYRAVTGQIVAGEIAVGDEVVALPSGLRTRVTSIDRLGGPLANARAPQAVALQLEHQLDVGRGELLAAPDSPPIVTRRFEADVVWLGEQPSDPRRGYLVKHGTRVVPARIERVCHRVDLETIEHQEAPALTLNDIGRLALAVGKPLVVDRYQGCRATGAFIVIDAQTNATVGAGMITEATASHDGARGGAVSAVERRARFGHGPVLVWNPAKAEALERALWDEGLATAIANTPEAARACVAAGLVCLFVPEDRGTVALRAQLAGEPVPMVETGIFEEIVAAARA